MEKITKKNSILYNQLWTIKAIEEGYINLIPDKKLKNMSIGEQIEINYKKIKITDTPKITKKNSLLFSIEWLNKYKEEGLKLPKYIPNIYSIGEVLELRYFERGLLKEKPHTEDILLLPNEKAKKLARKL